MTEKHTQLIDDYLSGRLDGKQVEAFETELSTNPDLSEQLTHQTSIVEGISEYRKNQLKSRLDAIDPFVPGYIQFFNGSVFVKSLGGIVAASIIATGVYFSIDTDPVFEEPSFIDAPESNQSVGDHWNSIKKIDISTIEIRNTDPVKLANSKDSKEISTAISGLDLEKSEDNQRKKEPLPNVIVPSAGLIDDKDINNIMLDELDQSTISSPSDIEVTTSRSRSLDIKYKYYDGKLYLVGDFDRAPYEILEINSAKSRRIFIFYLNNYYKVETTDKLKKLPMVTSRDLIKELTLLKETK